MFFVWCDSVLLELFVCACQECFPCVFSFWSSLCALETSVSCQVWFSTVPMLCVSLSRVICLVWLLFWILCVCFSTVSLVRFDSVLFKLFKWACQECCLLFVYFQTLGMHHALKNSVSCQVWSSSVQTLCVNYSRVFSLCVWFLCILCMNLKTVTLIRGYQYCSNSLPELVKYFCVVWLFFQILIVYLKAVSLVRCDSVLFKLFMWSCKECFPSLFCFLISLCVLENNVSCQVWWISV